MLRLITLCVFVLVGCERDQAEKPKRPDVDLSDPLALVPAESDMVMRIDVAALRKSSLWKKYEDKLLKLALPAFAECGYNPFRELESITVGIPIAAAEGIFVLRGLDPAKTLKCAKTPHPESNTKVSVDGDFVTLKNKSGAVNMFTFVGTTLVMQGSKNPTQASLAAALKMGSPLRQNKRYMAVHEQLDSGAALTLVMVPGSTLMEEQMVERLGAPVLHVYGSFRVDNGIGWHVVIELATERDARELAERVQPQLSADRDMFDRLQARAQGNAVVIDAHMTEAQLATVVEMVQSMLAAQAG